MFYISLGRRQWFFADEWEFLSGRGINGGDLLRAHYGHWVAVPIVVYRVLWQVVGLRSYVPYVGLAILLHLVAAGLLWVIMRRAQVRPWTATLVASVFVLFGAGAQDILWAFQITFTGALVFGLIQLLLADHDGPIDVRDWIGLGAGFLGLMCSGVAVTMVIVVGIATLLRRSWRAAAFNTVPLGVIYGAWWLKYSRGKSSFRGSPHQILDWFFSGTGGIFSELGSVRGVGWLIAALLIGGGVLVARRSGVGVARERLVLPVALLIGAAAFLLIAAFDRGAIGSWAARSGRYLHILAALILPAVAVAIDALRRSLTRPGRRRSRRVAGRDPRQHRQRERLRCGTSGSSTTRRAGSSCRWAAIRSRRPCPRQCARNRTGPRRSLLAGCCRASRRVGCRTPGPRARSKREPIGCGSHSWSSTSPADITARRCARAPRFASGPARSSV